MRVILSIAEWRSSSLRRSTDECGMMMAVPPVFEEELWGRECRMNTSSPSDGVNQCEECNADRGGGGGKI